MNPVSRLPFGSKPCTWQHWDEKQKLDVLVLLLSVGLAPSCYIWFIDSISVVPVKKGKELYCVYLLPVDIFVLPSNARQIRGWVFLIIPDKLDVDIDVDAQLPAAALFG